MCEHDIMCVCLYKCINKIDVVSTNSIPTSGQNILWLWRKRGGREDGERREKGERNVRGERRERGM